MTSKSPPKTTFWSGRYIRSNSSSTRSLNRRPISISLPSTGLSCASARRRRLRFPGDTELRQASRFYRAWCSHQKPIRYCKLSLLSTSRPLGHIYCLVYAACCPYAKRSRRNSVVFNRDEMEDEMRMSSRVAYEWARFERADHRGCRGCGDCFGGVSYEAYLHFHRLSACET